MYFSTCTSISGTGTRLLDRCRRAVEARHPVATTGQIDCVVAKAATSVKHLSADRAERFEFHEARLGMPDVPRDGVWGGCARECGFSAVEAVVGFAVVPDGFRFGTAHTITVRPATNARRCAQGNASPRKGQFDDRRTAGHAAGVQGIACRAGCEGALRKLSPPSMESAEYQRDQDRGGHRIRL